MNLINSETLKIRTEHEENASRFGKAHKKTSATPYMVSPSPGYASLVLDTTRPAAQTRVLYHESKRLENALVGIEIRLMQKRTYRTPMENMTATPAFFSKLRCNLQITVCGRTRISKSMARLTYAAEMSTDLTSMHFAGIHGFQVCSIGMQDRSWRMKLLK